MRTKKIIKWVFLTPVIIFFIYWIFSLAKCEILTLLHGDEFKEAMETAQEDIEWCGEIDYFKIVDFSNDFTYVYAISQNDENIKIGHIFSFKKDDATWKYNKWEWVMWSSYGNGERIVWPYWWHFIYFSHF